MLGLGGATLSLLPVQRVFFLFPNDTVQGVPRHDSSIQGQVVLKLPKATKVNGLAIKLVGHCDLDIDGAHHHLDTIDRQVDVEAERNGTWEKGEHAFAFTILIPTTTAPQERCSFGRVYHRLIATAPGLGNFGAALETSVPISIIASPALSGMPPPPLDLEVEDLTELGPMRIAVTSERFTVSGLCLTDVVLPSPPADAQILSVALWLQQDFEIVPPQRGAALIRRTGQRRAIFKLDARHPPNDGADTPSALSAVERSGTSSGKGANDDDVFARLAAGAGFRFRHLGRLPHDDLARGTTSPATQTPIRIRNSLIFELAYRIGVDGTMRQLSVVRDIKLASCCCLLASLVPPAYAEIEYAKPTTKPFVLPDRPLIGCLCGLTLQTLIEETSCAFLAKPEPALPMPAKVEG